MKILQAVKFKLKTKSKQAQYLLRFEWKQDSKTHWLNDAPSQSLQQSLKNLDRAYQNFFSKRAQFPQFKKRGVRETFRYPQGFKLDQV